MVIPPQAERSRWRCIRQTTTFRSTLLATRMLNKFFAVGQVVGSAAFQVGAAGSLLLIGRFVVPEKNGSKTNKFSHLGFDLIRAQIVSQTMVHAIKYSVQRD